MRKRRSRPVRTAGEQRLHRAPAGPVPETRTDHRQARRPASWFVELQRSPMLTIMTMGGVLMGLFTAVSVLPVYFLVPAVALIAVVGSNEVRPILAERRVARAGRAVPGVVTKLEPMKRIRRHPLEAKWTVAYRFTVDGTGHDGRTRPLPWQVLDGLEAGDEIAVHVDPQRPTVSAWIAGA